MTKREKLKSMTDEELAKELCYLIEMASDRADVDQCEICPVTKICKRGRCGFLAWLRQNE